MLDEIALALFAAACLLTLGGFLWALFRRR